MLFLSCMNIRWRICFTMTHESRYNSKNNYLVLWTTQNLFFLVLTTHITNMGGNISSEIHFNLRWMDSFPVVSFWILLFFAAVCIPVSKLLALYGLLHVFWSFRETPSYFYFHIFRSILKNCRVEKYKKKIPYIWNTNQQSNVIFCDSCEYESSKHCRKNT